jgi:Flp pilus assembly protein TadG
MGHIKGERGQALAETAVIFSILLLLAMGVTDFSIVFQSYIGVINAANNGAQVAAISLTNAQSDTVVQNAVWSLRKYWRCTETDNKPAVQRQLLPDDGSGETRVQVRVTCTVRDLTHLFSPLRLTETVVRRVNDD